MPASAHTGPAVRVLANLCAVTFLPLACTPISQSGCRPAARSSSVVSGMELRAARVPRLLEAIRRVRPRFLQTRTPRRDQSAVVYVDGTPAGDVRILASIQVVDVLEVIYLGAADATTRFGTDHTGGALLVRTNRGSASRADRAFECLPGRVGSSPPRRDRT